MKSVQDNVATKPVLGCNSGSRSLYSGQSNFILTHIKGYDMGAVLGPEAAVTSLAVPHLRMRALACPAVVPMFVAVGAFRGFKDTTSVPPAPMPFHACLAIRPIVCGILLLEKVAN